MDGTKTAEESGERGGHASVVVPDNRRRDPRFEVPGGLVRTPCKPFEVWDVELDARTLFFGVLPSLFLRRYELLNLSKGGLAFESRWPVRHGAILSFQLWIPEEAEPLELIGEARWCRRTRDGSFHVGVQFAPYGRAAGMNPPSALETIRTLETKYTST